MSMKDKYPNQLYYMLLVTAEEILGKNGLNSVLNYAGLQKFIGNYPPSDMEEIHPSSDFTKMIASFLDVMGQNGAKTILFRGGVRGFEIMYEQFPALFNIDNLNIPDGDTDQLFEEFKRIYGIMVDASVQIQGDIFKYYETDDGVALEISPCHWCAGIKSQNPICHAQRGFQFAIAKWITKKEIKIDETHCIATGDDMCRFVMHRPK
jgi:predicted hydrocarbon binding protein